MYHAAWCPADSCLFKLRLAESCLTLESVVSLVAADLQVQIVRSSAFPFAVHLHSLQSPTHILALPMLQLCLSFSFCSPPALPTKPYTRPCFADASTVSQLFLLQSTCTPYKPYTHPCFANAPTVSAMQDPRVRNGP
jgi:hypothetical protein